MFFFYFQALNKNRDMYCATVRINFSLTSFSIRISGVIQSFDYPCVCRRHLQLQLQSPAPFGKTVSDSPRFWPLSRAGKVQISSRWVQSARQRNHNRPGAEVKKRAMNWAGHNFEILFWKLAPWLVQAVAGGARWLVGTARGKKMWLCADSGDLFTTISYAWVSEPGP